MDLVVSRGGKGFQTYCFVGRLKKKYTSASELILEIPGYVGIEFSSLSKGKKLLYAFLYKAIFTNVSNRYSELQMSYWI